MERIVADARPPPGGGSIRDWVGILNSSLVEQKKRDAVRALRLLGSGDLVSPPPAVDFTFTTAFARDLEQSGISESG
jgi:hypothetical protein